MPGNSKDARWNTIAEFVKQIAWPGSFSGLIGRLMGGISLLALLKQSFDYGIGPVLMTLLDYYDKLLAVLLDWAHPYINIVLIKIGALIGWPFVLYPHWKHVFVLLEIYFFREATVAWTGVYGKANAVFCLVLGLGVAFISSVATGVVPIVQESIVGNFMIGAIPVLGAALYGVIGFLNDATFLRHAYAREHHQEIPTWWEHYVWGIKRVVIRSLIGLLILWIGLQVPVVQTLPSPGLAMFGALVFVFGIYWLLDGIIDSARLRVQNEPRWSAYWRSNHTQLGTAMVSTFFWIALFLLLNAGLSVFGL
jgi:hypothetical protein